MAAVEVPALGDKEDEKEAVVVGEIQGGLPGAGKVTDMAHSHHTFANHIYLG